MLVLYSVVTFLAAGHILATKIWLLVVDHSILHPTLDHLEHAVLQFLQNHIFINHVFELNDDYNYLHVLSDNTSDETTTD